jgi:hypothetical protein
VHRDVGVAADEDNRKAGLGSHKCRATPFTGFYGS